jgi:uncharacterized membrane protein
MNISRVLAAAIAAAIVLPTVSSAAPAPVPTFDNEKCYGIAAKAANDCGSATHSCAGNSTKAKDPASWVYVPKGTCAKIADGSTSPKG